MKQAIVMRTDLKMGKGKIAAQACHASICCYKKASRVDVQRWELDGQKKVVLKIQSEEELFKLYHLFKESGLVSCMIRDAGHTQIDPSTVTCIGIGPGPDDEIDKLVGHLKLL